MIESNVARKIPQFYRRRNTPTYSFMAWAAFVLACGFEFFGIYTLEEPLYVKGYYAIAGAFLIVSCLVLQKTIRDNEEDNEQLRTHDEPV